MIAPLGDLNGDGCDDFPIGESSVRNKKFGSIAIFYGSNDLSVREIAINRQGPRVVRIIAMDGQRSFASYHSLDFDENGLRDCLIRFSSGRGDVYQFFLIYGRPDIRSNPIILDTDKSNLTAEEGRKLFKSLQIRVVATGDTDGDGCDDFILLESRFIEIVYGQPRDRMNEIKRVEIISTKSILEVVVGIAVGDINGDGRRDLVLSVRDMAISSYQENAQRALVLLGGPANFRNDGTTRGKSPHSSERNSILGETALIDLNRDGFDDLVLSGANRISISFGRNDIDSLAMDVTRAGISIKFLEKGEITRLGDFDNDSFPDFSVSSYLFPSRLLASSFPSSSFGQKDHREGKSVVVQDLMAVYVRRVVQELMMMVLVLLTALLLFLCLSRGSSSQETGTRKTRGRRKSITTAEEAIEMAGLLRDD